MRWRAFALISLGVNVALAAVLLLIGRPPLSTAPASPNPATSNGPLARTNIVVRRQFFSWRELESADYPTYIANLRFIGCPEQTIRDIIIAEVNSLYARKRALELVTPEQQWWRSEPDTNVLRTAFEKGRALEEERSGLLTRLLGPNWESGDMVSLPRPSRPGVVLDGTILGALAPEAKQAIQELSVHSNERIQAYLDAQAKAGKNPDPVDLAKLRQQTREDLARVLSPAQLEEFLLRYSQNANDLRADLGQLQYFNASPDEFRSVFRATDSLDQQIQQLADNDPNSAQLRDNLELARENAIKGALGPKRYEEYQLLQDPLYRQAMATAMQAGTPDAVSTLYQVNLAAAAQQDSIEADTSLTPDQKNIELKRLELDQLEANTMATGQDLPPEPQSPAPPPRTYVLHQGDTAAVVSMIYGVPVSALRQANPNLDLNRLRPGDSVVIPQSAPEPGAAP